MLWPSSTNYEMGFVTDSGGSGALESKRDNKLLFVVGSFDHVNHGEEAPLVKWTQTNTWIPSCLSGENGAQVGESLQHLDACQLKGNCTHTYKRVSFFKRTLFSFALVQSQKRNTPLLPWCRSLVFSPFCLIIMAWNRNTSLMIQVTIGTQQNILLSLFKQNS